MKILRVGDPHITVRNLAESKKLVDFICQTAQSSKVDYIELMGDLFHTHAVMRMEVVDFWAKTFEKFERLHVPVYALVGNHDQLGSKEKEQEMNSLNTFQKDSVCNIISSPFIVGKIAYIPYMSNQNDFVKAAKELYDQGATKCLVAHQNFTIPLYGDMIDRSLILQEVIVAGHIHEKRTMNGVIQVGTPKWDTMSDANEEKGIWIFDHNEDGSIKDSQFISTGKIVTPIVKIVVNEGDPEPELNPNARNYLELHGKTAWISKMKKKYKAKASIKAKPIDRKVSKLDVDKKVTLVEYLQNYFQPIDGVTKQEINGYLRETLNV